MATCPEFSRLFKISFELSQKPLSTSATLCGRSAKSFKISLLLSSFMLAGAFLVATNTGAAVMSAAYSLSLSSLIALAFA